MDWQSTKNGVLQRSCHMFNNSDMSDISFTCNGSSKTFYAHKYVLGTTSVVFRTMFYGEMAEKSSAIHLPDATEEGFEQFLRYIYTEECKLTTDTVAEILYLAKKYVLPFLMTICVDFLQENINDENVLDVLEQATRFDEEELENQCWQFIQLYTGKVVASDAFNNISQSTIAKLLMQDTLSLPEVKLFQAVLKWIDFQCSIKNVKQTGENRRSIIGKAIYAFRFFSMSQLEFVRTVSKTGLLTADEMVTIFEKFIGEESPALKWKLPNRKKTDVVRFSRFPGIEDGDVFMWITLMKGNAESHRLRFSVNKDALFLGVRMFGEYIGDTVRVRLKANGKKVTRAYTCETKQNDVRGFDVMLKRPLKLKQDEVVLLSAKIENRDFRRPMMRKECCLSKVTVEGVTVTFRDSVRPNNGTSVRGGQFHEIILSI